MEELAVLSSARIAAESTLRSTRNERDIAHDAMKRLLAQADLAARALHIDKFRAPKKLTDQALINGGRAFVAQIEPQREQFTAYGFSPDDVAAAVKPLELAVLAYAAAKTKRSAAIRVFHEKLDVARECLRRFEAIVANTLVHNPAAMTEWTMARTISKVPARKRAVDPPKAA